MDIKLIKFEDSHLRYIEIWENDGEIYNHVTYSRPKFLRENLEEEKNKTKLYMVKYEGRIIGCAWLEEIDPEKQEAKLGMYFGETKIRGKGLGQYVTRLLLSKAFRDINLKKVYLHVRERNFRAISCYKKCGFKIIKEHPKRKFGSSEEAIYEMTVSRSKFTK